MGVERGLGVRAETLADSRSVIHTGDGPCFRVDGLVVGLMFVGFRFEAICFRVSGFGARVQGSVFRVQGSGFRVQGLGCKV